MKSPIPATLSRPALAAALLGILTAADAQVVDISQCRAIENAVERFRCYEELGHGGGPDGGAQAPSPAAPAAPAAEEEGEPAPAPSPNAATVEDFGREPSGARLEKDAEGRTEMRDTIASYERIMPNRYEITLSSGQVWRQVEDDPYYLEEGAEVRIYPTRWGTHYRLSQEGVNSYIQVKRIR